ncbi:MAG: ABC transporter permease [Candidatus Symbiothrix sp.]|jgi:ABC-type lipoprotein release transport system permease subunit|nr:ABC transporter permease [Candidatus Symbiothrix sp.]
MLKLAWRNIWRNKRRSIITMTSVFIALFFCTLTTAFIDGMWNQMIKNMLKTQAGNIEIHGKGYWDDKTVDNFMTIDSGKILELSALENVENLSLRVETFAMASHKTFSKGIAVVGISPENETKKQKLNDRIAQGEYLQETDPGVMIGEGLANYLKVSAGDTLAFLGQGYHGASAAGLFPIRGILDMPLTEMNNGLAFITLQSAQTFIDLPDGYSGILISLNDDKQLDKTIATIRQQIDNEQYDVYPWHFTMADLLRTAESDKAFDKLMLFILYLIVGFGILGTVIMMTNERHREFSVMISLGMQRRKLKMVFALEMLLMTAIAIVASLFLTIPISAWFHIHPIVLTGEMAKIYADMGMEAVLPMTLEFSNFFAQIVIVTVMTLITLIYSFHTIQKLKI